MKASQKPSTSKLVTRFDNALKNILMEDLKSFKAKHQFMHINKKEAVQQSLSAA
jgi:hypothetical protein